MPHTTVLVFRDDDGSVPLTDWLDDLRQNNSSAYGKCIERLLRLEEFGHELRRPLADYLRDGIYELRTSVGRVNYRLLYAFVGKGIAVVSHGFTKEKEVPSSEIELAMQRVELVKKNQEKYTAEFDA